MKILLTYILLWTSLTATYYSQCGQDQYVFERIFKEKKGGVFLDIGAHNGILFSNTYFLEKEQDWTGLCVEANPDVYPSLKQNRSAICLNACVVPKENQDFHFLKISGYPDMLSGIYEFYDPRHLQRIQYELNKFGGSYELIKLPTKTINQLLEEYHLTKVDFLSLDIEAGELEILKSIDFDKYDIGVITVENNYNDLSFELFMKTKGYLYIQKLEQDQIFIKQELFKSLFP